MSSYSESINWLFHQFPNYQKLGKKAYKADLGNISLLLKQLNSPQKQLKFVHVAGTNGKGSVCSMIASTLSEAGYKTGLFTSPHLSDFRERIRIDGNKIPEVNVIDFCEKAKRIKCNPSFFEITFAMALEHFYNEQCDICIIEVGLGGRLDATNIITPELSVITSIGVDHTDILGDSLSEIAKEKAGIIKKEVPLVLGEKNTTNEIISIAKQKNSPVYFSKEVNNAISPPFDFGYPLENAKTAFLSLEILNKKNILKTTEEHFKKGLINIQKNTGYKARLEILKEKPTIIFDGAHNTQAIENTINYIQKQNKGKLHFIYGSSHDKDYKSILSVIPNDSPLYLCSFKSNRSLTQKNLINIQQNHKKDAIICSDVNDAISKCISKMKAQDKALIFGSFFLYGEILEKMLV